MSCCYVSPEQAYLRCIAFAEFMLVAAQGSTFGIPGVEKYSHPLRDIHDANAIRNNLIANWSKANTPTRCLHCGTIIPNTIFVSSEQQLRASVLCCHTHPCIANFVKLAWFC